MISRRFLLGGVPFGWAAGWNWPAFSRDLRPDEHVLFVPRYARDLGDRLEVAIEAWVFEFERRRGARSAFARVLGVDLDELSPEEQRIFEDRARLFLSDSERGKRLSVEFLAPLSGRAVLPPTNRAGRAGARVVLPAVTTAAAQGAIRYRIDRAAGQPEPVSGAAPVIAETGLSVVSDIDDTIKKSDVGDRKALLLNTFMRPFAAVAGMADHYGRLSRQAEKAAFHYLSSSPIQLLPALQGFLRNEGFPEGSMHLRESTAWDRLLPRKGETQAHKTGVLNGLLADFPKRDFLLVGDSGEHDPEIYAALARAHPARAITIVIRDLGGKGRADPRYAQAFAGLSPERWHLLPEEGGDWPL